MQKLKNLSLPIAMLSGIIFYDFFAKWAFLLPYMIFSMLFFAYCGISLKDIKIKKYHLYILAIQVLVGISSYIVIKPFDVAIAEGVMICIFAPTAAAAAAVVSILGGNVGSLMSFGIISNIAVAVIGPIIFSYTGLHSLDSDFITNLLGISYKIIPLLALPFVMAMTFRRFTPVFHSFLYKNRGVTFYLWVCSLTILFGKTISYVVKQESYYYALIFGFITFLICILQFALGRIIGRKNGDTIASGNALGQKNTVLAIWLSQVYLMPIASIAPAAYVLWQNIINSWQLFKKRKNDKLN